MLVLMLDERSSHTHIHTLTTNTITPELYYAPFNDDLQLSVNWWSSHLLFLCFAPTASLLLYAVYSFRSSAPPRTRDQGPCVFSPAVMRARSGGEGTRALLLTHTTLPLLFLVHFSHVLATRIHHFFVNFVWGGACRRASGATWKGGGRERQW